MKKINFTEENTRFWVLIIFSFNSIRYVAIQEKHKQNLKNCKFTVDIVPS